MISPVEARDIQQRILDAYGIRVDAETGSYIARQIDQSGRARQKFAVIGGQAKTGEPLRLMIDPAALSAAQPPTA